MLYRILVIDDEESLCEILKYNLEKEGYEVDCAYSAEEALEADLAKYSLFIVDIMMTKMSGFDFVRRLKDFGYTQTKPVIFCSALGNEDDKITGLNIGADDYVTKPFVIGEVLARVRAVLRRTEAMNRRAGKDAQQLESAEKNEPEVPVYEDDVKFKTLRIDRNEKAAYIGTRELGLTRIEFELLLFFLTHRNRVFSREEIFRYVWPTDVYVYNRTVDTSITRLRKKLGEYGSNIVTRQGFGYGFKETI